MGVKKKKVIPTWKRQAEFCLNGKGIVEERGVDPGGRRIFKKKRIVD